VKFREGYGTIQTAKVPGTAARAKIEGVVLAGKTGTAQAPPRDDHSWYASWAPYDHPKLVVVGVEQHRTRLKGPHDIGDQPSRRHHHAVNRARDADLGLNCQVQVASGQQQPAPRGLESHSRQNGQSDTSRRNSPARSRKGINQNITLASKLHTSAFPKAFKEELRQ